MDSVIVLSGAVSRIEAMENVGLATRGRTKTQSSSMMGDLKATAYSRNNTPRVNFEVDMATTSMVRNMLNL